MTRLIDLNDGGPYTVKGCLLHDCSLDDLEAEAEAGRSLKARGWTGTFQKLHAVETEIMLRKAST